MQTPKGNLFTRPDTLLGVCEGLGQDFGFNPILLRIALAASILWSPVLAFGSYAALGLLVLLSRLICPDARLSQVNEEAPAAAREAAHAAEIDPILAEAA